jgi:hypothetical protein
MIDLYSFLLLFQDNFKKTKASVHAILSPETMQDAKECFCDWTRISDAAARFENY